MQSFDALFRRFGQQFEAGDTIFAPGDPADAVYVVNQGRVRESRVVLGMEKHFRELGPGDFLGEIAVISGRTRNSRAQTLESSRLLVLPAKTFATMLRTHLEIAARVMRGMAAHIDSLERDIGHLLHRTPEGRLVSYLAEMPVAGAEVELSGLAGALALQPAEVEALTPRLTTAGLVRVEAGYLAILDSKGLHAYLDFLRLRERFGAI